MNNYGYRLLPGWDPTNPDLLAPGTRVKIRHSGGLKGRVLKWTGPLAPGGVQTYRIRFGPKGNRLYAEVRRDQLIPLPPKPAAPQPPADPS